MSESNESQIKSNCLSEESKALTPERRRFDEGMSPVSPRESPTTLSPSHSERSPSSHHDRSQHRRHHHHHRSQKIDHRREEEGFKRDRRKRHRRSTYEPLVNNEDNDKVIKPKRHRYDEGDACDKRSEKIDSPTEEPERLERRDSHRKERIRRRSGDVEKRPFDRESHYRGHRDRERDETKRSKQRSGSRQSQSRVLPGTSYNRYRSPRLCPFVSTLLKPLLKEVTSDTELEDLLPVGILSGEMAKRSMPHQIEQSRKTIKPQNQKQHQLHSQTQQAQEQPLLKTSVKDSNDPSTSGTIASSQATDKQLQKSTDESESRFDKFLSSLSEQLKEREQDVETWSEREIDFSDILTEESCGVLQLAASAARLKPKQLLEASLSTPWQKITENSPGEKQEEEEIIKPDVDTTEGKEDPFNLAVLLPSSVSRRFLGDQLVQELEAHGVIIPPTSGEPLPVDSRTSLSLGMVPGIFEISWRQRLLGVTFS